MFYKIVYILTASIMTYAGLAFTFGIETTHRTIKQTMKDFSKK